MPVAEVCDAQMPLMFFQVIIKHQRVGIDNAPLPDQPGQGAHAPVVEHHVAVAMGVGHASFVGEHGHERWGLSVQVGRFLDQPPGVFLAAAVIVVAVADPVEGGGIERVAPHVFERSVGTAVRGDLGVAVELAAEQAVGSCRRRRFGRPGSASGRPVSSGWTFAAGRGRGLRRGRKARFFERRRGGERRHLEVDVEDSRRSSLVAEVSEIRLRVHLGLPAQAAVGTVEGEHGTLCGLNERRSVVEQAVAARQGARRRPSRSPKVM